LIDIAVMVDKSDKSSKSNINSPLGMRVGIGPGSSQKNPVKITDNSLGWGTVAKIPVPPAAEIRTFQEPLGLIPALINGGIIKDEKLEKISLVQAEPNSSSKIKSQESSISGKKRAVKENALPTALSFMNQGHTMKIVEIDWYGAKLLIQCIDVIYQKANFNRGGQEWLMLEIPLNKETLKPSWQPPVAQLEENGRISVPEFYCTIDEHKLKCQILNIELLDLKSMRYILILRVLN